MTIDLFENNAEVFLICSVKYKGLLKQTFKVRKTYSYPSKFQISTLDLDDYWEEIDEVEEIEDVEWAIKGYCEFDSNVETSIKILTRYSYEHDFHQVYSKKTNIEIDYEENDYTSTSNETISELPIIQLNNQVSNSDNNLNLLSKNIIYCSHCGITPSSNAPRCCLGTHTFVESDKFVYCRHCGITPSSNAPRCCLGTHTFVESEAM